MNELVNKLEEFITKVKASNEYKVGDMIRVKNIMKMTEELTNEIDIFVNERMTEDETIEEYREDMRIIKSMTPYMIIYQMMKEFKDERR